MRQSLEEFAKCFIKDEIIYTPFIPPILNAWEKGKPPNMFFIKYEEIKTDIRKIVVKLISFLCGSSYTISDKNLDMLLAALEKESFRKKLLIKFVNRTDYFNTDKNGHSFIKKGVIRDWKIHFDEEMNKEWDVEIEKQLLESDFK